MHIEVRARMSVEDFILCDGFPFLNTSLRSFFHRARILNFNLITFLVRIVI